MEKERITLSQRERDRMRVLHEVKQGHLTQREAGRRLRLSDRQVRRLLLHIGKYGDQAVIHGLRGRRSNRKLPASFERKVLVRMGQWYAEFGPTLASEYLTYCLANTLHSLSVSTGTISGLSLPQFVVLPHATFMMG
jgi:hypothetical protein